jgi:hypothetical protein
MVNFKGSLLEWKFFVFGVHWYVAYAMNHRQIEEVMGEHRWRLIMPCLIIGYSNMRRLFGRFSCSTSSKWATVNAWMTLV